MPVRLAVSWSGSRDELIFVFDLNRQKLLAEKRLQFAIQGRETITVDQNGSLR
jgi:hypothetical protein